MTNEQKKLLLSILAGVDSLWTPFRWRGPDSCRAAAAIAERREAYRKRGLPFASGDKGELRRLAELRRLGLVSTHGKTRRTTVRPTAAGDDLARRLAPVNTVDESWPLLEAVAALSAAGATNAGHVLEVDLLGVDYGELPDSKRLTDLEDFALPLLARGLLTSASDALGRIGYGITPAGRAALARGEPKPKDAPEYDSRLGREYAREYLALVEEREGWRPERPGLVAVPLSAGRWPRLEATK